jgi:hypothetical protein
VLQHWELFYSPFCIQIEMSGVLFVVTFIGHGSYYVIKVCVVQLTDICIFFNTHTITPNEKYDASPVEPGELKSLFLYEEGKYDTLCQFFLL